MHRTLLAIVIAVAAVTPGALAGTDGEGFKTGPCTLSGTAPMPGSGVVRNVPADYPTIQAAVDQASPGDTILIAAGEYKESVEVTTPYLRIRGADRDQVVLNGENTREIGIDVDGADGVVVENMTAHNYVHHGFFWLEAKGYWGRYLTAYNNGLYGLYAFDSRCGQIDHSYTSGNADSGFYIGECFPCDAVIHDVVAEQNAIGYSGTNAGGDLVLRDSIWRGNAMGIVPNSLDGEERPPQQGVIVKHNQILANNTIDAPGEGIAGQFWGIGIALAGANGNQVYGNTVTGNALAGIVVAPLPDQNIWISSGNRIWGNTVAHDAGVHPNSMDLAQGATSGPGNCWADNQFLSSSPPMIQDVWSCGLPVTPPGGDPSVERGLIEGAAGLNGRAPGNWATWPVPDAPEASIEMPAELTGPIGEWLPALF